MTTRSILRSSTALVVLVVTLHATAGLAAAECTYIPPFPRAEPAIRSADEVIIGELIEASAADLDLGPDQGPRTKAVRVVEVLRGPKAAGDLVDVEYLLPNWPWLKYPAGNGRAFPSCTYLTFEVNVGDTIALALGAVQPRQRLDGIGVTWIQPRTTYNAMTRIRRPAQLDEIRRLAALPETDMAREVATAPAAGPAPSLLLALALGLTGGGAAWWSVGRRSPRPESGVRRST